jgi:N-acetylglucosaminyl-diphospho-decaprenol L-rhamnosyltransferase
MSIYKDITIVIVTYKSSHIIHKTISQFDKRFKILISENSKNNSFKDNIENSYVNCKVHLIGKNSGVSHAVNYSLKKVRSKYAFFLTPDVTLLKNSLKKLYLALNNNQNIAIISARDLNSKIEKLYGFISEIKKNLNKKEDLTFADWVLGGALLINMKHLSKIGLFDNNFFLDYEEIDLCVRARKLNFDVVLHSAAFSKNLKHGSVNTKNIKFLKHQRLWHFGWSIFYFNKKHFGYLFSIKKTFHILIISILKLIYHLIFLNFKISYNYIFFIRGYFNSLLGNRSLYRTNL